MCLLIVDGNSETPTSSGVLDCFGCCERVFLSHGNNSAAFHFTFLWFFRPLMLLSCSVHSYSVRMYLCRMFLLSDLFWLLNLMIASFTCIKNDHFSEKLPNAIRHNLESTPDRKLSSYIWNLKLWGLWKNVCNSPKKCYFFANPLKLKWKVCTSITKPWQSQKQWPISTHQRELDQYV